MDDTTPIPPMPAKTPKPAKNHWRTATYCLSAALLATSIGLVYALGSEEDGDRQVAAVAPEPSLHEESTPSADPEPVESPAPSVAAGFTVGEEARNGGAVVTVTKVRVATTIKTVNGTQKAGSGAKYVVVETVVFNDGKSSMDLTCSLPIVNNLIDAKERRYDTIDHLYEVTGNPECNDQLQPGFKNDMHFVYRVPADAEILTWEFAEYDLDSEAEPATVRIGALAADSA